MARKLIKTIHDLLAVIPPEQEELIKALAHLVNEVFVELPEGDYKPAWGALQLAFKTYLPRRLSIDPMSWQSKCIDILEGTNLDDKQS